MERTAISSETIWRAFFLKGTRVTSYLEHPLYTKPILDPSVTGKAKWTTREQYSLLTKIQNGQRENRLLHVFSVSEGLVSRR